MARFLSPLKAKQLQRNLRQLRVSIFCFLLTFLVLRNTIGAGKFGTPAQDFEDLKHHFHHFHHHRHVSSLHGKQRTARVLTEATISSSSSPSSSSSSSSLSVSALLEEEDDSEEEMMSFSSSSSSSSRSSTSSTKSGTLSETFRPLKATAEGKLTSFSSSSTASSSSSSSSSLTKKMYAVDPDSAPVIKLPPGESSQLIDGKASFIPYADQPAHTGADHLDLSGWKRLGKSDKSQPKSLHSSATPYGTLIHSSSPPTSKNSISVLIVTGFWPSLSNCSQSSIIGEHFHLRSLGNKLSFATLHHNSMDILYHSGPERPEESKLSFLQKLMAGNPQVEWLWWMDSDAFLTDISFELPLQNYTHHNLVFYGNAGFDMGNNHGKDAEVMKTDSFLIRNCEWSLDFLQRWTEISSSGLNKPGMSTHEESNDEELAVTLMLSRERTLWEEKVFLDQSYALQGHDWSEKFANLREFPTVVSFDHGCSRRCEAMDACLIEMERVLHLSHH